MNDQSAVLTTGNCKRRVMFDPPDPLDLQDAENSVVLKEPGLFINSIMDTVEAGVYGVDLNLGKSRNPGFCPKLEVGFESPVEDSRQFSRDVDRRGSRKVAPFVDEQEVVDLGLVVKDKTQKTIKRPLQMAKITSAFHQTNNLHDVVTRTHRMLVAIKEGKAPIDSEVLYDKHIFSGFENIELLQFVSKGSFGEVHKFRDKQSRGRLVVKKMYDVNQIEPNELLVPLQFPEEDNIVNIFGCRLDSNSLKPCFCLVMEDAGVSLRQLVCDPMFTEFLNQPGHMVHIMLDILTGLEVIARAGICHLDIKPENLTFDQETKITKLVDFGSSKSCKDEMTSIKGITVEYADPQTCRYVYEVIIRKLKSEIKCELGEKYDVWAALMVGLFLIMKADPVIRAYFKADFDISKLTSDIRYGQIMKATSELSDSSLWSIMTPLINNYVPPLMRELLQKGLIVDKARRPTAAFLKTFLEERLCVSLPTQQKQVKIMDMEMMDTQNDDEGLPVDLKKDKYVKHGSQPAPEQTSDQPIDREIFKGAMKQQVYMGPIKPATSMAPQQTRAASRTTVGCHDALEAGDAELQELINSFNRTSQAVPGRAQMTVFNLDGQRHASIFLQPSSLFPPGISAVQGLTGQILMKEERVAGPELVEQSMQGNVPNINMLMGDCDRDISRKRITAKRRSRVSND